MVDNRWYDPDPTLRKRGRESAASVTVLPMARTQPRQPPARFTAAEKAVWRETIKSVRPGWFAGSEGVLAMYCTSIVLERGFARWLKQVDDPTHPCYRDAVMAHRAEASLAANLATKLRLTVRSTKDRYAPKAANWPKPWEPPMMIRKSRRLRRDGEFSPLRARGG